MSDFGAAAELKDGGRLQGERGSLVSARVLRVPNVLIHPELFVGREACVEYCTVLYGFHV